MVERLLPPTAGIGELTEERARLRAPPARGRCPAAELDRRLRQFSETAQRFSRDFVEVAGTTLPDHPVHAAFPADDVAKSLFSKWVIEILLALYAREEVGFQDLRRILQLVSPRVLSGKLRVLEERGLVRRTVLPTRPARVHYSLTSDGLVLASLGEPVFIFLRYRHDRGSSGRGRARAAAPRADSPVASGGA